MAVNKFITKNGALTSTLQFVDVVGNNTQSITMALDSLGTLSFDGANGQLFSVTDNMTGTIFSVNDISGIPSIEVLDDGTTRLAEFAGNILIGTNIDNGADKLQVLGNIKLGDNNVLKIGNTDDLKIYHDGNNSRIRDEGTGELRLESNNIRGWTTSGINSFTANGDGAFAAYFAGAQKVATTSTGIDIAGNITVSGTVDGRDLASDGAKLDGIEAGATADQTKADIDALGINAATLDSLDSTQFLRSDVDDTATGNLTISKVSPKIRLLDTDTVTGSYPQIEFDTNNGQGVKLYHNEFDGELSVGGYGLILGPSDGNTQFPATGVLSLGVLGEIYAGNTVSNGLNKVLHTGNFGTTTGTVAQGDDSRINNGQTAFGWGDHSIAGYLTSFVEADPVFLAHTVSNIINGTGFLKNNGAGTWSYDNNSYSLTSHNHDTTYLSINATAANSQLLDNIDSTGFLRQHTGTVADISSAGYTTIAHIIGSSLGSLCKISLSGTANSVVVAVTAEIIVNHSLDIYIRSESGNYTQVTLKIISDGNADYYIQATTNHANLVTLSVNIETFNGGVVTIGNVAASGSTILEHICKLGGQCISNTGGVAANYYVNGTSVSLSGHTHTGVYEPAFTKNTAFNKNFGTTAGTVSEGNHGHSYLPLAGGTLDGGLNTTLTILSDDGGMSMIKAHGDTQGTGVLEVGQSSTYGGGISYNGDGTPSFVTGEIADQITFYNLNAGVRNKVFSYPYNSTTVQFAGNVDISSGLDVTGNITVTGLVDGVDIAAFKSNYDTLSATVVNEGDSVTLTGDVTGTSTFDTNGNVSVATTVVNDSHLHSYLDGSTLADLNTAINDVGIFKYQTYLNGATNSPVSVNNANGILTMTSHTGPYGRQIAFADNEDLYTRKITNNVYGAWRKLWHDGNDSGLTITESQISDLGTYEPAFTKNTAFNKNFGTTAGTVSEGDHTHSTYAALAGSTSQDFSTNNLVVQGSLTVNGPTTEINATTLKVDDKNIELGTVATPTDITAADGGITLLGDTNKTFTWSGTTGAWTSNQYLSVKMNGAPGFILEDTALNYEGYTGFYSVQGSAYIYTPATTSGNGHIGFMEFGGGDLKGELQVRKNAAWNVVFHEANQSLISITESQISDFGTYLTDISNQSIESLIDVNTMTPTDGQVLTYDFVNSRWDAADPTGGAGSTSRMVWNFTATAGQTNFTILYDNIDTVDVFRNGFKLTLGTDYTLNAGTTITLLVPADEGTPISVIAWNGADLYNAPNTVVTNVYASTQGQTVFTGNYAVNKVVVFVEGIKKDPNTYTATNGTSITFNTGVDLDTWVQIVSTDESIPLTVDWSAVVNTPTTLAAYNIQAADILLTLKTVDGVGSGLDAEFLTGYALSTVGNRWGVMTPVGSDGVMEIGRYIDFHASDTDTGDNACRLDGTAGQLTLTGSFTASGNITAYSDERIKNDIQVIDNALSKVQQLSGYTFERTDIDAPRQTGVIAQEVLQVLPEAVHSDDDGILSIAYGNMVGLLIEAIKEQQEQINDMKKEITILKGL